MTVSCATSVSEVKPDPSGTRSRASWWGWQWLTYAYTGCSGGIPGERPPLRSATWVSCPSRCTPSASPHPTWCTASCQIVPSRLDWRSQADGVPTRVTRTPHGSAATSKRQTWNETRGSGLVVSRRYSSIPLWSAPGKVPSAVGPIRSGATDFDCATLQLSMYSVEIVPGSCEVARMARRRASGIHEPSCRSACRSRYTEARADRRSPGIPDRT